MSTSHFHQASVRHLVDARVLLREGRADGACHAAGFAAECALKARLEAVLPTFPVKGAGHDIVRLADRETTWAAAASGDRALQRLLTSTKGSNLAKGHPERRYWETSWSAADAAEVVRHASDLVEHRVIGPWLDRGHPLDLG
jgi:HEPN domain-containing protein